MKQELNEKLENEILESVKKYGKMLGVEKIITYQRFLTICKKRPDFKEKIDKILSEKPKTTLESIFYMDQIEEHFTPNEIKNLRILIENDSVPINGAILHRCVGCGGLFEKLNHKKYCKSCVRENMKRYRY